MPEYKAWKNIKSRCYNSNVPNYHNYGGRGIKMCDSWRNSFEIFLIDMGERPGFDYSIDRINNDGDYEPNNCRWATRITQQRNRWDNNVVIIDGEEITLRELSERIGMRVDTLWCRLYRYNFSVEKAISARVRHELHNRKPVE